MKKILAALAATSLLLTGCGGDSGKVAEKNEIHVAAAASLTDAMKEIATEYKKISPNTEIIFNFGSSGALQQAIENGGETDLFFSAAQKQMDALEKSENILPETRKNLLKNEVVLIVPNDSDKNIKKLHELSAKIVSAVNQAQAYKNIEANLTDEEKNFFSHQIVPPKF